MRKTLFSVLVSIIALTASSSVFAKATKFPILCTNIGVEVLNAYRPYASAMSAFEKTVFAGKKPSSFLTENLDKIAKEMAAKVAPIVALYATLGCPITKLSGMLECLSNDLAPIIHDGHRV